MNQFIGVTERADLHIHTSLSDGTVSPEDVVLEASKHGINIIAITDHDTIKGIERAVIAGRKYNVKVIPAIELSSFLFTSEVHILGYFIDYKDDFLCKQLERMYEQRVERIYEMVHKLSKLNVLIDPQDVLDIAGGSPPGRLHLAESIWKSGYSADIKEPFYKFIGDNGPAFVPSKSLTPFGAIELIVKVGGVPVIAHPFKTDSYFIIPELVEKGLEGVEVYYPMQKESIDAQYLKLAREYNLVVTGGSDFHGARKPDICLGAVTIHGELVYKLEERSSRTHIL